MGPPNFSPLRARGATCYTGSMASFQFYQRGGIYTPAHPRIVPALTEITRAVGVPDVAISCLQPSGVGLHKTGEAADIQAGNAAKYGPRYREAYLVHTQIAKYILKHWVRLKVRYMAWDGWEYGGSWGGPERKRAQKWETWHLTASDPMHRVHVHVDFHPGQITGANPTIALGAAFTSTPPATQTPQPTQTPTPILQEDDMALIQDPKGAVFVSNGITKRHIPHPDHLADLKKVYGPIHKVSQAVADSIPTDQDLLRQTADDARKAKVAVGRIETRSKDLIATSEALMDATGLIISEVHDPEASKTLRTRMEQTNAAVGRAEKARLADEKKEQE